MPNTGKRDGNQREDIKLKVKTSEKKEKNEVELIIEVAPEEFEAAVNKAFIKNKNRIAVPGFRKGKAPRRIIEKMYGVEIFHSDALDAILPDVLTFAMKNTDLEIVGYPKISDIDIKDNNGGADITMIAAVHPEVTLGKYKGLTAPKPEVDIPAHEIDAEIASMRVRNARIEKADRPAAHGDIAVINFEGFVDNIAFEGGKGENYELELGSGTFIPGFEEKVEGMEIGEERDIDLVFPENYKEDLAGKPVVFKVKLNEVKEKSLPDLDDEFAKDVSEFDTLQEYKDDIKNRLQKTRQQDVDETFENILMEKVVDSMEAEVPEAMIEEQMESSMNNFTRQISTYGMEPEKYMQMMGISPEDFKERMRLTSERQVKVALALEKIAELEGIEIKDSEIEDEYKEASERYGMEIDKLKESVDVEDITRDLKLRAAAKIVIDSATVDNTELDAAEVKAKAKKETGEKKAKKPAGKPKKTTAEKAAAEEEK